LNVIFQNRVLLPRQVPEGRRGRSPRPVSPSSPEPCQPRRGVANRRGAVLKPAGGKRRQQARAERGTRSGGTTSTVSMEGGGGCPNAAVILSGRGTAVPVRISTRWGRLAQLAAARRGPSARARHGAKRQNAVEVGRVRVVREAPGRSRWGSGANGVGRGDTGGDRGEERLPHTYFHPQTTTHIQIRSRLQEGRHKATSSQTARHSRRVRCCHIREARGCGQVGAAWRRRVERRRRPVPRAEACRGCHSVVMEA